MFRIEFFCEDRNLANALRGLAGIAVGQPSVMPVINAATKGNTVVPATSAGSLSELFFAHLQAHAGTSLARKDVNAFAATHGRAPTVSQHLIHQAIEHGLLKKEDPGKGLKFITYRVMGGKK